MTKLLEIHHYMGVHVMIFEELQNSINYNETILLNYIASIRAEF